MPEEAMWDGFFDPPHTIGELGMTAVEGDVVEFGCGYGTFTVAAARAARGIVYALDVEREMVEATQAKVRNLGLRNVRVLLRDFVADGTGLTDASVRYAMVFNILHCEDPVELLKEARRVLAPGGSLGIIHWNHDPSTPRGPSMDIRPTAEQCRAWAESVGFVLAQPGLIDLPPHHYGWRMEKAI
jgi:ubiquinone/menaquinone biosynthesis C-methylase UbiE